MRRNTRLSHHVHGLGAHLKFNVDARGSYQSGVQRLIAVDFANGNVVLEFARNGLVHLMQNAQGGIAINDRRHNESEAIDVGHLCKTQMLAIHFFVDGKKRFFAARNLHIDFCLRERRLEFGLNFLNQITSSISRFGNCFCQNGIAPRL